MYFNYILKYNTILYGEHIASLNKNGKKEIRLEGFKL